MKYPLLVILAVFLFTCNKAQVTAQSGETAMGKVEKNQKLAQGPDKGPGSASLVLRMGSGVASKGEKICLPVEASGFTEVIGFQYTMRFDSASLQFDTVRNMNLPNYLPSNFGTRFADRGYISTLWTDAALKGTNLTDGHKIFEVCFTNLMDKGKSTDVKFQDGPTAFEVIDKDMKELRLVYGNGTVKSK